MRMLEQNLFFGLVWLAFQLDAECQLAWFDFRKSLHFLFGGETVGDDHIVHQSGREQVAGLQVDWQVAVHFQRAKSFVHVPWTECIGLLAGNERGNRQIVLTNALGCFLEHLVAQSRIPLRIEIVAGEHVVGVRLVAEHVFDVLVVDGGVELDFQMIRIVRHLRFLVAVEAFVKPDTVGVDIGKERQVVVRDAQTFKHVRRHIQNDFHAFFMRVVDQFLEFGFHFLFGLVNRQQARKDPLEAVAGGLFDVLLVFLQCGVFRIN